MCPSGFNWDCFLSSSDPGWRGSHHVEQDKSLQQRKKRIWQSMRLPVKLPPQKWFAPFCSCSINQSKFTWPHITKIPFWAGYEEKFFENLNKASLLTMGHKTLQDLSPISTLIKSYAMPCLVLGMLTSLRVRETNQALFCHSTFALSLPFAWKALSLPFV